MGLYGVTHHVIKEAPDAERNHLIVVRYACGKSRRVKYEQVRNDGVVDCMSCLVKEGP